MGTRNMCRLVISNMRQQFSEDTSHITHQTPHCLSKETFLFKEVHNTSVVQFRKHWYDAWSYSECYDEMLR